MGDDPLINDPGSTPFGAPIIDLAEVRIKYGRSRRAGGPCSHFKMTYDPKERRVWCEECERTIDNFDAFKVLVDHFHGMVRSAEAGLARAKEAKAAVLVRKAAKALDRTWGHKMAVACPHCKGGILPEDVESHGCCSREIEIARRKRLLSSHAPIQPQPPTP